MLKVCWLGVIVCILLCEHDAIMLAEMSNDLQQMLYRLYDAMRTLNLKIQ